MGPELINPVGFVSLPSKSSDCYAFGMVIYETISGKLPFQGHATPAILVKVAQGERPSRGVMFTDHLWKILEWCWASQPADRPSIEEALQCLEIVPNSRGPPSLGLDEEMEKDSDDLDSEGSSESSAVYYRLLASRTDQRAQL